MKTAPQTRDGLVGLKKRSARKRSEGTNDTGLDQFDLPDEIRFAIGNFMRVRISIAWGAAFQNIRDEYVSPRKPHRFNNLVKQLARCPNKGNPLAILFGSWRFAYQDQFRPRIARAEDNLGALLG